MAKYLLAYHGGGMAETEEEQAAVMAKWEAWYGALGASIDDGGAATMPTQTVAADGSVGDGGANPVTGYTVITADSKDDALAKAAGCPIRESGGSIWVGELIQMWPRAKGPGNMFLRWRPVIKWCDEPALNSDVQDRSGRHQPQPGLLCRAGSVNLATPASRGGAAVGIEIDRGFVESSYQMYGSNRWPG